MKEIPKYLIQHRDGTSTFFHPDMRGRPSDLSQYIFLDENEFGKKIETSNFPLKSSLEIASWGGVSVCLKLKTKDNDYAVVTRLLESNYDFDQIKKLNELEVETREYFSGFSIPQIKVIADSAFGSPLLLKIGKWIERDDPSLAEILKSFELSLQVRDLSKRVLDYFNDSGKIIDLSGKIRSGMVRKILPFTVVNSENIIFEKGTNRVYLVDSGLWPKNHCFNQATPKQKVIILSRLGSTAFIHALTSLAVRIHTLRQCE